MDKQKYGFLDDVKKPFKVIQHRRLNGTSNTRIYALYCFIGEYQLPDEVESALTFIKNMSLKDIFLITEDNLKHFTALRKFYGNEWYTFFFYTCIHR